LGSRLIAGVNEVDPMIAVSGTVRARGRVVSLYVARDERRASFHPYRLTGDKQNKRRFPLIGCLR